MDDRYDIRQANLRHLLDTQCGGAPAVLAKRIGRDASYVHRLLYPRGHSNRRNIGDEVWKPSTRHSPICPAAGWTTRMPYSAVPTCRP